MKSKLDEIIEKYPVDYGDVFQVDDGNHIIACLDNSPENVNKYLPHKTDLILIDPPYQSTDIEFDTKDVKPIDLWANELLSYSSPNGYLVSLGTTELLAQLAKIWKTRFGGVWVKPRGVMRSHSAKKPMTNCEEYIVCAHPEHKVKSLVFNKIYVPGTPYKKVNRKQVVSLRNARNQIDRISGSFYTKDGFVSINEGVREQQSVIFAPNKPTMKHIERTLHPTQKPLQLLETFIKWFTNENNLVLDTFGGSGSTMLAAKNLNRKSVTFEKDPQWVSCCLDRLNRLNICYQKL